MRLYTRRLDQPMAVELPGTESVRGPFFSPDSRWLGFASTTARKLYKISVDGGADHTSDGQEEVYVVVSGDAEFAIDGEPVAVNAGDVIRIEPASKRSR